MAEQQPVTKIRIYFVRDKNPESSGDAPGCCDPMNDGGLAV
jgi:hypothetical protein